MQTEWRKTVESIIIRQIDYHHQIARCILRAIDSGFLWRTPSHPPGSEVGERPAMSEALSSDASGLARMKLREEWKHGMR